MANPLFLLKLWLKKLQQFPAKQAQAGYLMVVLLLNAESSNYQAVNFRPARWLFLIGMTVDKELLLGKCWVYFNGNFHKFTQVNRIKIGLALCTRDMPTALLIDQSTHQHLVIFRNKEELKRLIIVLKKMIYR